MRRDPSVLFRTVHIAMTRRMLEIWRHPGLSGLPADSIKIVLEIVGACVGKVGGRM